MTQYVIFVDDALMLGAAPAAAAAAAAGAVGESFGATASVADTLAQRRSALVGMAAAIGGQPGDGGGGPGATAATARAVLESFGTASDEAALPKGMDVLEGIGAIVVDDAEVDIAALSQVVGLEVVENIALYLPDPVEAEAVAGPMALPDEDWHLTTIGLTASGSGGAGTIVGVLDTGIDAQHAEFAGKTVHFAEFDPVGRLISTTARDAGDHGTHVASTVAGRLAGVAPDAGLAVAAVLTQVTADGRNFGSLIQIVNGFNWLVVTQFGAGGPPGVDVINASLGGSGFNTYLQSAARKARGVGIGLIAAIGNDGRKGGGRHGSPGNYPEVLGIGASDSTDTVARFSDWGDPGPQSGPFGPSYPVPAFSAPGVDVFAAQPGGGFQRMSGTSMATPVVAGVAARRIAANANLRRNPSALFLDLQANLAPVTPHGLGNRGGAGRVVA